MDNESWVIDYRILWNSGLAPLGNFFPIETNDLKQAHYNEPVYNDGWTIKPSGTWTIKWHTINSNDIAIRANIAIAFDSTNYDNELYTIWVYSWAYFIDIDNLGYRFSASELTNPIGAQPLMIYHPYDITADWSINVNDFNKITQSYLQSSYKMPF